MVVTQPTALQVSERFGLGLQVQADGFFNPKVIKVLVNLVEAESQAHTAGLSLGDELIRVQDFSLPGTDTALLKPHMNFFKECQRGLYLEDQTDRHTKQPLLLNKVWDLEGCRLFLHCAYKSLSQVWFQRVYRACGFSWLSSVV